MATLQASHEQRSLGVSEWTHTQGPPRRKGLEWLPTGLCQEGSSIALVAKHSVLVKHFCVLCLLCQNTMTKATHKTKSLVGLLFKGSGS